MTSHFSKALILAPAIVACVAWTQERVPGKEWKAEGGHIISWDVVSDDSSAKQVSIADEDGHQIASLAVLGPVQDARRVSIYDVSARDHLVAVAAVYESKAGNRELRPAAALLLFNLEGQLLSSLALEPSHQIALLAIDDQSNVWTLTDHADTLVDPSTVPMLVEYTTKGAVAKELLKRSTFPLHASDLQQNAEIGSPTMGYEAGVIWFWLPGSTDFVTVSTHDYKAVMVKTLLPTVARGKIVPLNVRRASSGNLVAQVTEVDEQGKRVLAHYKWSPESTWQAFSPRGCEGGRLIGADSRQQVYLLPSKPGKTCVVRDLN
jgi:hypothetical protein